MNIDDDLHRLVRTRSRIGPGADGQPWLVWEETGALYCLTEKEDKSLLTGMLGLAYMDEYHTTLHTDRYVPGLIRTLIAEALRLPPLPEITESYVTSLGRATLADKPIDLSKGELAVADEVVAWMPDYPDMFCSDLSLVRMVRDSEKQLQLSKLTKPKQVATWARKNGIAFVDSSKSTGRSTTRPLPSSIGGLILARDEWPGVRKVVGISPMPVVRQDGSLAYLPGYDDETGLIIDAPADLMVPEVRPQPSTDDVEVSGQRLYDRYQRFPWDKTRNPEASLANALALLFTPHLRRTYPGMLAPLFAVSAPTQSSGKTLIGGDLPGTWGGGGRVLLTMGTNEEETRKRLTTEMRSGGSGGVLCFDNVEPGRVFKSPFLAAVLTAEVYSDRLLGGNTKLVIPQSRTFTVTGNHLTLDPDMARRTVLVTLDPDVARPEKRPFAERLDNAATRVALRPEVVGDLLTCLTAWVQAGAPTATVPTAFRQFTSWAERMGGLLEFLGVEGFLSNSDLLDTVDDVAVQLGVLWRMLFEKLGSTSWTGSQAAGVIDGRPELDDELPHDLASRIVRGPDGRMTPATLKAVAHTFGYLARRHSGAYHDGLRLERSGTGHGHVTTWSLRAERGR